MIKVNITFILKFRLLSYSKIPTGYENMTQNLHCEHPCSPPPRFSKLVIRFRVWRIEHTSWKTVSCVWRVSRSGNVRQLETAAIKQQFARSGFWWSVSMQQCHPLSFILVHLYYCFPVAIIIFANPNHTFYTTKRISVWKKSFWRCIKCCFYWYLNSKPKTRLSYQIW